MPLANLNITVPLDGMITLPSEFRGQNIQIIAEKQNTTAEELPELTEDEIVAFCKQVRKDLRRRCPELYAPN